MQHQQWKGSTSQKFSSNRRHIEVAHQLGHGLQPQNYYRPEGLRTFQHNPTQQAQFSSCLKVYKDKYISDQKEIDSRGKKTLILPQQVDRKRPQLRHVKGGSQTSTELDLRGIKTFELSNTQSNKQYEVQNKLQRKARILGLQGSRNQINVASMGDKPYKYPEYSVNFYNSGGLVPGSTITYHSMRKQFALDDKKLKSVFTKPHWNEVLKIQEKNEQKRVVDSVDAWEQTILKENNPKWQDPQTFFERLEATQATAGKDAKKGAKK